MKSNLIAIGFLAMWTCSAAAQAVVSTFDSDADGWTLYDDGGQAIEWLPSAGNPGGCVRFVDSPQGFVGRFAAPAKFLGDKSAYLGGTLRFDTYRETAGEAGIDPIVLEGGSSTNLTLYFTPTNVPPYASWLTYTIPLLASSGWTTGSTNAATEEQLRYVLSSLQALRLPADHIDGADSSRMDNVFLEPYQPLARIRVSEVEVCWSSVPGGAYRVEYRSELTTNTWLTLRECVPGTGTDTCIYDKIMVGQPQRFYRVAVTNCVP